MQIQEVPNLKLISDLSNCDLKMSLKIYIHTHNVVVKPIHSLFISESIKSEIYCLMGQGHSSTGIKE